MVIHQMSEDEKIQELARLREKALHDEASAQNTVIILTIVCNYAIMQIVILMQRSIYRVCYT